MEFSTSSMKKRYIIISTKKTKKMPHFDFKAIIASRGYHVYKETVWSDAKVNNQVKTEIEIN